MKPVDYVSGLNEMYQSQGFPPYSWSEFDSSPWTPFQKSLDQTCLALISSGGIFKHDQEPLDPWAVNDLSHLAYHWNGYRVIAAQHDCERKGQDLS